MKDNILKKFSIFLILSVFLITFMPDIIKVNSKNFTAEIVIEQESGRILHEENSNEKMPMASTTKILTAITVINNFDISKDILIKKEYTNIEGSSLYLKEGETLTGLEILYGLMLRSGNDCAVALALEYGKSIENFCKLMNLTANKAGAFNSNFKNPHGLHDKNHYTTAFDLAMITRYALKNATFKKIVSTKEIKIGKGESTRLLKNKNKMLNRYKFACGVKTGYTKKAGRCLVTSTNNDGFELISVVLNCGPMYERSEELLNEAYTNFSYKKIAEKGQCVGEFADKKGNKVPCFINRDLYYPLKAEEENLIKSRLNFKKNIKLPLKFNEDCGTIEFYLAKQLLFSEKIYTIL